MGGGAGMPGGSFLDGLLLLLFFTFLLGRQQQLHRMKIIDKKNMSVETKVHPSRINVSSDCDVIRSSMYVIHVCGGCVVIVSPLMTYTMCDVVVREFSVVATGVVNEMFVFGWVV